MKQTLYAAIAVAASLCALAARGRTPEDSVIAHVCLQVADDLANNDLRDIADNRSRRFLSKVEE